MIHEKVKLTSKIPEYIGTIIVNIVLIYVFNNLLNWHIWFLQDSFTQVLWIFTLSFVVNIFVYILFLVYDASWFKALLKLGTGIIALWAIYSLYKIFPINFGYSYYNNLAKYLLLFCLIATIIGVVVEFFTLIFLSFKEK